MYQVKTVYHKGQLTEYYVLNTQTGKVHSAWSCRQEANATARSLNNV